MRTCLWALLVVLWAVQAAPVPAFADRDTQAVGVVVCAPGYPSTTEQAQPTMDSLARGLERSAGWREGRVEAAYHPELHSGLAGLSAPGVAFAIVPLPLYLERGKEAGLKPMLEVVQPTGPREVWSLVTQRGAVNGPGSLDGWEISGLPGYAPGFVRDVVLAGWGSLPETVEIRFGARVLSSLRRAAQGEPVAVLLDSAQSDALSSLPFAADLEVVFRSEPMVGALVCSVGGTAPADLSARMAQAFLGIEQLDDGEALLQSLRMRGFRPLDADAVRNLGQAPEAIGR